MALDNGNGTAAQILRRHRKCRFPPATLLNPLRAGSSGGAGAPGVMPYAQSAGCAGAAAFGEPASTHEPVSGRVLLQGMSKLDYPAAPQRTETSKVPLEARPSFAKWGGFSSTD